MFAVGNRRWPASHVILLPIHQQHDRLSVPGCALPLPAPTRRRFHPWPTPPGRLGREADSPRGVYVGHRTLNHRRRVIRRRNSDSTTSSGVRPNGSNRVHRAHHRHFLPVHFGLLLRIMTLDRGFRGGSSHGNALAIGTHHAQAPSSLGAGAGRATRNGRTVSAIFRFIRSSVSTEGCTSRIRPSVSAPDDRRSQPGSAPNLAAVRKSLSPDQRGRPNSYRLMTAQSRNRACTDQPYVSYCRHPAQVRTWRSQAGRGISCPSATSCVNWWPVTPGRIVLVSTTVYPSVLSW